MKKVSFLLLSVCLLAACGKMLYNNSNVKNIYMLGSKPAPANNYYAVDPVMRISRVEPVGDSVRLYTHILDNDNTFITGVAQLRSNWCSLVVNDMPVREYTVREVRDNDNVPTVYALVLDHSGSMAGKVDKMQSAVRAFIAKKKPQDAICIVKYDTRAVIEVAENVNSLSIQQQFNSNGLTGFGGGTAILNGIMMGMEHIRNSAYRRKVVISFTDGADNSSTITKDYVTWYAQQSNINLCTIDFNNSPYNDFMPELANNTGGTYTYFKNTADFNYVFDDVVNKMNHAYIVSYKRQQAGRQQIVLRYCAEPKALEAKADFNTIRNPEQPVKEAPVRPQNNVVSTADQPVYTRPVSNYPSANMPVRMASNTGSSSSGGKTPTTRTGASEQPAGGLKGDSGTKDVAPGTNTPGGKEATKSPVNSVGKGESSKPTTGKPATGSAGKTETTKPVNSNSGSSTTKPGTGKPTTGSSGGPGSAGAGNGGSSGSSGSSGAGSSGKGTTKPATSKPSSGTSTGKTETTKPVNNSGSSVTKPGTSKPSGSGSSSGSSTKSPSKTPTSTKTSTGGGKTAPGKGSSTSSPTKNPNSVKSPINTP